MFNTKKDLYAFTGKVYNRLKRDRFMVKFIRSKEVHGLCYKGCKWIELTADGAILTTLVHEMLHDIYPEWEEEKVASMEKLVMAQLSHRQMINLMKALAESLDKNYKILKEI